MVDRYANLLGVAAKVDWSKAVDLERAARNLHVEMVGDWHQDPWGWPELAFVAKKRPDLAVEHLSASVSRQAAPISVPKENWGTRPAVVLDILDRLCYQAVVDRLSIDLIGKLSPNAFGWRLPPVAPTPGGYSRNGKQWDGYRDHLYLLANSHDVALATDIVSFFASIPVQGVQSMIDDRCSSSVITKRLHSLLEGFSQIPDRSGLVQRSTASAVLANMYLQPMDDVARHHATPLPVSVGSKLRYHSFARWMDDIWLFVDDPASARSAQMDLQAAAHLLGLNLNSAKTDVYEGDQVAEHALLVAHSAVDDGLSDIVIKGKPNFAPLEELIDRLIGVPERASRTSLKFATQRMREHNHFGQAQAIISVANRMPHAADALFRLFKEAFTHDSLQDWYLDYANGPWATHQWSVAQLGRIFPSGKRVRKPLREFFATKVRDANTSLTLLSVAAQRLASWDDAEARDACRDAYGRVSTAHARRVLALVALGAGEGRAQVRRWLRADDENSVTLAMLEDAGFSAPKVTADFWR